MARTHAQYAVSSLTSYFLYKFNIIQSDRQNKFIKFLIDYVNGERNKLNSYSHSIKLEQIELSLGNLPKLNHIDVNKWV